MFFTFEGDSSLSGGGKTKDRSAAARFKLMAIARRQFSMYSLSGRFNVGDSSSPSSSSLLVESGAPPSPPGDLGAS